MAKLYRAKGELVTLVNDRIFDPPVAVIENIVIRPAELNTIKCDCGELAINWLVNVLRAKQKHTCEKLKCIQKAIKVIKD